RCAPSLSSSSPHSTAPHPSPPSFPPRRSSDLSAVATNSAKTTRWSSETRSVDGRYQPRSSPVAKGRTIPPIEAPAAIRARCRIRSEEHTSELQSRENLVCRLLLEKKKGRRLAT